VSARDRQGGRWLKTARERQPPCRKAPEGIRQFVVDDSGATAIEYALIASLIAVFIITAAQALGKNERGVCRSQKYAQVTTSSLTESAKRAGDEHFRLRRSYAAACEN